MWATVLVMGVVWGACTPDATDGTDPTDTDSDTVDTDTDTDSDTDSDSDTGTPDPREVFRLPPPTEADGVFAASHVVCASCHTASDPATALRDASDRPIGPADLWPASMMAHAARDPFFRTALAAEKAANPGLAEAVDEKCLACHSPAAHAELTLGGQPGPVVSDLASDAVIGELARDGATCLGCHLQTPDDLGARSTWGGKHPFNDERLAYGPHRSPFAGPMRNVAGFEPTWSEHVFDSELCVSCHTLEVDTVDADGVPTGHTLLEQGPYVEWRSSAYDPARAQPQAAECQTCHMPLFDEDGVPIQTRIARDPRGTDFPRTYERQPVARHTLLGGNAFALDVMREHRDLLGSPATDAALGATIDGTRAFLRTAADVVPGEPVWSEGAVSIEVDVQSRVGHKLPTGFPARRAWLELEVTDATGATVWHVGATDAAGRLLDASGEVLPRESLTAGVPPHTDRVRTAEDVVVYETWLVDPDGRPTSSLLQAAAYAKDSRLLPIGWSPSVEDAPSVAAVGTEGDPSFGPGGDTVTATFTPTGTGPWTLHARLRYQSLAPRYLDHLRAGDTPEAAGLDDLLGERGVPAEVLAEGSVEVPVAD